jgi:hexulose-6-phosphate isomerase
MNKAICWHCLPGDELDEDAHMAAVRQAGFAGVELTVAPPFEGALPFNASFQYLIHLRALSVRDRVKIHSVVAGSPPAAASLACSDPAAAAAWSEWLRRCIEITRILGAPTLTLTDESLGLASPGTARDAGPRRCAWACAALQGLAPTCEAASVDLALENGPSGSFLGTPAQLCDLLKDIGVSCVGASLDVGTVALAGTDVAPKHWVGILGPRLLQVRLKDARRAGRATAAEWSQLLDGQVDFPSLMAALRAAGYGGYLTADVGASTAATDGRAQEASRTLDRILAM